MRQAHDDIVACICAVFVLRVPSNALMALAFSCFHCNIVGSLLLFCRLALRAFCCCAFLVSSFVFPVCDVQSVVFFMFFLHASSLPSLRVRRPRFLRGKHGLWLLPYVLGFRVFRSAAFVVPHCGQAHGRRLWPQSPLVIQKVSSLPVGVSATTCKVTPVGEHTVCVSAPCCIVY